MLYRLADIVWFAAKSAALTFFLGAALVGVSCFRHGDVGPYPELDYAGWIPPAAMLIVYATRTRP